MRLGKLKTSAQFLPTDRPCSRPALTGWRFKSLTCGSSGCTSVTGPPPGPARLDQEQCLSLQAPVVRGKAAGMLDLGKCVSAVADDVRSFCAEGLAQPARYLPLMHTPQAYMQAPSTKRRCTSRSSTDCCLMACVPAQPCLLPAARSMPRPALTLLQS